MKKKSAVNLITALFKIKSKNYCLTNLVVETPELVLTVKK